MLCDHSSQYVLHFSDLPTLIPEDVNDEDDGKAVRDGSLLIKSN